MALKVGIVGAGGVGTALGSRLVLHHPVKYGVRDPTAPKFKEILTAQPAATLDSVDKTIAWADVTILATPGPNEEDKIRELARSLKPAIAGKVLIDATNPLTPYPGLEVRWSGKSGGEIIAEELPETTVFKAFNTIGVGHLNHGDGDLITGVPLTMLIAGGPEKRDEVETIVKALGFVPVYVGPIRYARNLEAIAELWIHAANPGVGTAENWGGNFHFQLIQK